MPFLRAFGAYLPSRAVSNTEIAALTGVEPEWIRMASGIEERRFAAEEETVADLGRHAAAECLERAAVPPASVGMVLMASGTAARRFPGPAVSVAQRLGISGAPAIDLPIPSAGSLFGLALAAHVVPVYRNVLVIGADIMSRVAPRERNNPGTAVLFGDGAGACLVSASAGVAEIRDSLIYSDGAFSEDLRLEFECPLEMNGRAVILQASRKLPRTISDLLGRNQLAAANVDAFLLHQANQNLLDQVARALGVPSLRFFSNLRMYGNTSAASLLIAAAEWSQSQGFRQGVPVVFAAFGAGFNWGALLVVGCGQ